MTIEDINKINEQFNKLGLPDVIKLNGNLSDFGMTILIGLGINLAREVFRMFSSLIQDYEKESR